MVHLANNRSNALWGDSGIRVNAQLTPREMLVEAGLDWEVEKQDIFLKNSMKLGQKALVNASDSTILSIVGEDWNPVQNLEALEFFNEFVQDSEMKMESIGSLKEGKIVWALAKIKKSVKLFGIDKIDGYILFTNPHQFGKTIDVKFIASRALCDNTLTYALDEKVRHLVKLYHSTKFKGDTIKETVSFANKCLNSYHKQALFLASKYYNKDTIVEYFSRVFPNTNTKTGKREVSNNALRALEVVKVQPGALFAEGTYYQAFNAVTYMIDHVTGTDENRLYSAWYGPGEMKKRNALYVALEMAENA